MSKFTLYPVPSLGTRGVFTLAAPFTSNDGEVLECIDVRSLTSYIANNDDALQEVFLDKGLTQDDYDQALAEDMEIVALMNMGGFVYKVPASYIQSYPIQDGVYYRPLNISTSLPMMAVGRDLGFLVDDIKELITARLGVRSASEIVEMATPRAFEPNQSKAIEAARTANVSMSGTSYQVIAQLQNALEDAQARIRVLEQYIISITPS